MNRRFVAVNTIAGTTSLIPVDSIIDVDQVIKNDKGGELPRELDKAPALTTRIRYVVEDGYAYRFLKHTPEEVLKLISIAR